MSANSEVGSVLSLVEVLQELALSLELDFLVEVVALILPDVALPVRR